MKIDSKEVSMQGLDPCQIGELILAARDAGGHGSFELTDAEARSLQARCPGQSIFQIITKGRNEALVARERNRNGK